MMLETSEYTNAGSHHVSSMAQEREFYKYCQLPERPGLLHQPPATPSREVPEERVPQSSHDTTLTALAQLGALRLNAQRCMISLFDRHTQYILAEATRTLSLQDDRVHVDGDALWLGSSVIPKVEGICHYVCERSELNAGQETQAATEFALVIPDMTQDDRSKDRHYVVNAPHLRFYAGVPILSRRGIAIGAFSVSDGVSRSGLDPLELRFMKDTAEAIMNYLEMKRSHQQNRRGANMIAGLGNFVDGQTLSSVNLRNKRVTKTDQIEESDNSPVNPRWRRYSHELLSAKENSVQKDVCSASSAPGITITPQEGRRSEASSAASEQLHTKTLSSGTKEIFGRAAHVLRQSLEVDGVIFFDASVRSYGSLVRNSDGHQSEGSTGSGEGESSSDSENPTTGHSSTETDESAVCDVLGNSIVQDDHDKLAGTMRESFLRSLLRNYPRGGVFHIDENGWVSSSEGSDSATGNTVAREIVFRRHEAFHTRQPKAQKKRQKLSLKEENKALVNIFPSARSVVLFPLWDSRRNRWFSGLFVWTTSPRIFSLKSELAYLHAFTNSVMAEIHRLDIELANKANRTLVSSISHELRSPLHGILGSTDLLRDSSMTPPQQTLVQTIEHCGRSLLDIINNMLDFAKINQFTRNSRSSRFKSEYAQRRRPPTAEGDKPSHGIINLVSDVQLDSVLEEVVDTVFAGHCFSTMSGIHPPGSSAIPDCEKETECPMSNSSQSLQLGSNGQLTIIYDVEPAVGWLFETQAGVWRRILMNLFGNSLKYTRSGYIHVSLKSSSPSAATKAKRIPRGDAVRHNMAGITLKVKDTGQGIDKEYLQSNIFKPFSQEDPLSPGSGLGLSIVHQTVLSMGGKIDITSTKGGGTEVTISMDLFRTPHAATEIDEEDIPNLHKAKESASGKSVGLIGFESEDESVALLGSSLKNTCQEYLELNPGFVSLQSMNRRPYDIYLVRQSDFHQVNQTWKTFSVAARDHVLNYPPNPPVIVICPTPEMAQKMSTSTTQNPSFPIYEFISQPCGPAKVANAVMACINRRHEQQQSNGQPAIIETELQGANSLQGIVFEASRNSQDIRNQAVSYIDLPLTPPKNRGSTTTSIEESIARLSTVDTQRNAPSILLVDDNDVNLKLLVAFMKKAKFPYFTASNGLEALEVFKANFGKIDIVLMDISMPIMDGLESTREIRLVEKMRCDEPNTYKPAVVIALSGLGSAIVRQEAFNSGVDLFLSKPVRYKELIKQINEIEL